MGLLDGSMQQGHQMPQGQIGGLLGGGMPMQHAPQNMQGAQGDMQDKQMAMQLATKLASSPTPETVAQIVSALGQYQTPDSQQIIQALQQSANDPQALQQIAQAVIGEMSK